MNSNTIKSGAFFTTSWDDGHPLDFKVAELLAKYGMKGTFYVPTKYSEWELMTKPQICELQRMGMEIGSHTVSHAVLTEIADAPARYELSASKHMLEDLLGSPVSAFCFPKGRFNSRTCALVQEAGYRLARTTVGFRTGLEFDPASMPVSVQFVPHSWQTHVRHALKEGNAGGLWSWLQTCRLETNLKKLSVSMLTRVAAEGGIFHLWGHSWEVDRLGLWRELEDTLKAVREMRMTPVTNSELV